MEIVERIEELRKQRGWTINEFVEQSGIAESTLSTMFTKKSQPKLSTLQNICDAFGITLSQFFLEDEYMEIINDGEKELLAAFRQLTNDKKIALLTLLKN